MAIDGLTLHAVVQELQPLIGGKIDKVQQPEKDSLLFIIRSDRQNYKLLINTHAENGRMQLTTRAYDNPVTAPAFCMLLRRHLVGGRILSITQPGADRSCTFRIAARNELMDEVELSLVAELMGKHSNLILVGPDNKITDSLRRISPSETSTRIVLSGFTFTPAPAQEKISIFEAGAQAFAAVYAAPAPVRALTDACEGVSKVTATALTATCDNAEKLQALVQRLAAGETAPCVIYNDTDEPIAVLPFIPREYGRRIEQTDSISAALDAYYAGRDGIVRMRRHGASLRRTVENALGRAENKRRSFLEAIGNEAQQETLRLNGELILANLHSIKSGADQFLADNYYTDPPTRCIVPLDPSKSAQENAKHYFKLYRKGKLARDYATAQLSAVNEEIAYLEGQLNNIAQCDTLSELAEIREELIGQRYVKPDKKAPRKQQFSIASRPMEFRSSDGIAIHVGKNNKQNDALTMHYARGENLWLHAKDLPGSHVIVDFDGMPPDQTLVEAATLAAYYSGGRSATAVAVDYTLRKNIKKPAGARPGMVIFSTNYTVMITPDAQTVKKLRNE